MHAPEQTESRMNAEVVGYAITCWLLLVATMWAATGWRLPQSAVHRSTPHKLSVAEIQVRLAAEQRMTAHHERSFHHDKAFRRYDPRTEQSNRRIQAESSAVVLPAAGRPMTLAV